MEYSDYLALDYIKQHKEEFEKNAFLRLYYNPNPYQLEFYFVLDYDKMNDEIIEYWRTQKSIFSDFEGSFILVSFGPQKDYDDDDFKDDRKIFKF